MAPLQSAQGTQDAEAIPFDDIIDLLGEAVVGIDAEQRICVCNRQASLTFGYEPGELLGRPLELLIPEAVRSEHRQHVEHTFQQGVEHRRMGQHRRVRGQRKDGTTFPSRAALAHVQTARGALVVAVVQDLTEEESLCRLALEAQHAVAQARERSMDNERRKAEVLQWMAHEARQPLAGMSKVLQALLDMPLPTDIRVGVRTIERSTRTLARLLDQMVDLARLEVGELRVRPSLFDLEELVDDIRHTMEARATRKGIALDVACDCEGVQAIKTDRLRLWQVLGNLLHNAVQFTEQGSVHLRVGLCLTTPGDERLLIAIRDSGPRLHDDVLRRMGAPFRHADPSLGHRLASTESGLAVTGELVRMLGGELCVKALPDGNLFNVSLPVQAPDLQAA